MPPVPGARLPVGLGIKWRKKLVKGLKLLSDGDGRGNDDLWGEGEDQDQDEVPELLSQDDPNKSLEPGLHSNGNSEVQPESVEESVGQPSQGGFVGNESLDHDHSRQEMRLLPGAAQHTAALQHWSC